MSRRWRYPRNRRGEFFDLPRDVPQPVGWIRRATRLSLPRRRGRFLDVPSPQVQQAPPPLVLAIIRQRLRFGVRARRGVFWPTAAAASQQPAPITGRRARIWSVRRGRFMPVPLAGLAPVPPPPPPSPVNGRRARTGPPRRGHFQVIPLAGLAPALPPAVPPQFLRPRVRPWPPRRGRFTAVPPGQQGVPQWIGARRRGIRIRRRGQFFTCPSQVSVQPAVWRPEILSSHRRPWRPVRRGCYFEPPWPQIPPPPFSRGTMHDRSRTGADATATERNGPDMAGRDRAGATMGGG